MDRFLGPELLLPLREPLVLHGIPADDLPYPDTSRDDSTQVERIFRVWDVLGLLKVVPAPSDPRHLCRVFGAYKNPERDRMIGDRRGPNSLEGRVVGPSRNLPPGHTITSIHVTPRSVLVGASTDRADFYHQIAVSDARASWNAVGPPLLWNLSLARRV